MAETDEEQIEAIKTWWKENGKALVFTFVFVLGSVFLYRVWQGQVLEHAEKASALYEDMTLVVDEEIHSLSVETLESTRAIGNRLKIDFPDTIYAFLGALHMAKIGVEMGDLESAETELRWMLENDVDAALQPIVQMRLASIVAAQGRPEDALLLVYEHQDRDQAAHASSWYEMRGDIFYQLNDIAKAREAYQIAINASSGEPPDRMLLAKLQDITFVKPE